MKSDREIYCKITSDDLKNLPEDQKLSKLCSEASLNLSKLDNSSMLFRHRMERRINLMQRIHVTSDEKENCAKGWIEATRDFGPVLNTKFAKHTEDTALKLKFHLYSKIKPLLGLDL